MYYRDGSKEQENEEEARKIGEPTTPAALKKHFLLRSLLLSI
jgi:hypothetical protein